MSSFPYSTRLSPRDQAIVNTVCQFDHATTSQLLRLHFSEPDSSPTSRPKRAHRALKRLSDWKVIRRLPRTIGTGTGGSQEYVYVPPDRTARQAKPHTVDITELYVRLVEAEREHYCELLDYLPEREAYDRYGHTTLHPDARLRIRTVTGTYPWYIEVDRGHSRSAEFSRQLADKMRGYVSATEQRKTNLFPRVLFTALDKDRKEFIERVVRRMTIPELFVVVLYDDAVDTLLQ